MEMQGNKKTWSSTNNSTNLLTKIVAKEVSISAVHYKQGGKREAHMQHLENMEHAKIVMDVNLQDKVVVLDDYANWCAGFIKILFKFGYKWGDNLGRGKSTQHLINRSNTDTLLALSAPYKAGREVCKFEKNEWPSLSSTKQLSRSSPGRHGQLLQTQKRGQDLILRDYRTVATTKWELAGKSEFAKVIETSLFCLTSWTVRVNPFAVWTKKHDKYMLSDVCLWTIIWNFAFFNFSDITMFSKSVKARIKQMLQVWSPCKVIASWYR